MKFLIIGVVDSPNTHDLANEILKRGHEVDFVKPKDFIFEVKDNDFQIKSPKGSLMDYDIYFLRGYNISLVDVQILTEKLLSLNKVVVDEIVGKTFVPSKLYEASRLTRNGIRCPDTFQISDVNNLDQIKDRLNYPVIVKPVYGQKGQGIEMFEDELRLKGFLDKNSKDKFLIQEYLPIDGDLRIFVVGNKVLGGIKRFVLEGDYRSNASLGARAEKIDVDPELESLAIECSKTMGYEIAGVDLARVKNKLYVLEVNSTPQWQKFKEVTGIDPAIAIVDYAIEKVNNQKL